MMEIHYLQALAFTMLFTGSFLDIRDGKIPNSFLLALLACAFLARLSIGSLDGWVDGLLGFFVALGFYLPLWLTRVMGAGDVKFFAVLGMCLGPVLALKLGALSLVFAGTISVIVLLGRDAFIPFLKNFYYSSIRFLTHNKAEGDWTDLGKTKIPYIPIMAVTYLGIYLLQGAL